jgi:hypothetical protein
VVKVHYATEHKICTVVHKGAGRDADFVNMRIGIHNKILARVKFTQYHFVAALKLHAASFLFLYKLFSCGQVGVRMKKFLLPSHRVYSV